MAVKQSPLQGGVGEYVTTASGGGDTYTGINSATGAIFVQVDSVVYASIISASTYMWRDVAGSRVAVSRVLRASGNPAAETDLFKVYAQDNSTTVVRVAVTSAGTIRAYITNATTTQQVNFTAGLSATTEQRVVFQIEHDGARARLAVFPSATSSTASYDSGWVAVAGGFASGVTGLGRVRSTLSAIPSRRDIVEYGADVEWSDRAEAVPIVLSVDHPGAVFDVVDVRGSFGGVGVLSYTIAPSAGVLEPVAGLFLVPRGSSSVEVSVSVTDGVTAEVAQVVVPAVQSVSGSSPGVARLVRVGGVWV